jgi:hypothetical protein
LGGFRSHACPYCSSVTIGIPTEFLEHFHGISGNSGKVVDLEHFPSFSKNFLALFDRSKYFVFTGFPHFQWNFQNFQMTFPEILHGILTGTTTLRAKKAALKDTKDKRVDLEHYNTFEHRAIVILL